MNQLRNERGAALVLVLGMILLFMILGMVLVFQASNTQKQIEQTEEQIDARNVAEMGFKRANIGVERANQAYEAAYELEMSKDKNRDLTRPAKVWQERIQAIPGNYKLDEHHAYTLELSCNGSPATWDCFNTNGLSIISKASVHETEIEDERIITVNRDQ